jgi:hypothetical protein
MERFHREDHESYNDVKEYEEQNGTVPSPQQLRDQFTNQHLLDGPTAPIWECFLQQYGQCFEQ